MEQCIKSVGQTDLDEQTNALISRVRPKKSRKGYVIHIHIRPSRSVISIAVRIHKLDVMNIIRIKKGIDDFRVGEFQ